jgi:hypothetical protein
VYILDASRLRDDLVHNRVSPTDFAIYAFLIANVAIPIWVPQRAALDTYSMVFNYGVAIGHLVIAAYGTRVCYVANGSSTGRDFLNRFISLGWIVGVRLALLLAIPLSLLALSPNVRSWVVDLALLGAAALYYWRLSLQISLVHELTRPAA